MRKSIALLAISVSVLGASTLLAQSTGSTVNPAPVTAIPPVSTQTYPQVKAYLSFIIPWFTINKNTTTTEFQEATSIGFPTGINIYYSDKFAFSYEITPTIQASKPNNKNGTSKTSNLLFDPGPMFRFKHNWNLITRLAFETQGRYGFTPVLNKVYLKTKAVNYFVAISAPVRFGNSLPSSIGGNLQIGFTFN